MREKRRRLIRALYNVDEAYYESANRKKLFDSEITVMYAMDDGQPHSQAEICREWLVPKTTVNTIVKRWERLGYVIQEPIPGKRREMQVVLTDAGRAYAKELVTLLYRAEEIALKKTLQQYPEVFIEALECFGNTLRDAFAEGAEKREI